MRTLPRLLLASCVVTAIGATAAVAQEGLVATPKGDDGDFAEATVDDRVAPAEQEDALKLFVGSWRCTGTSSTDYGADAPTSLTITGKKDLAGRWLTVKTELTPKAKGAKTIATSEVWGYSRAAGSLVRNGASSEGGFIASTSAGWTGERFSWTGTSAQSGKNAREKFAVEKKSDKEISVELSLGVEELRVVFDGTCKR